MDTYKFIQNKACKYWMCHEGVKEENFSCLFCYCPWFYHCGSKEEVDCKECIIPHEQGSYAMILQGIHEIKKANALPKGESMFNACRCAKQITIAIIENKGEYWIGTNWCGSPQKKCPRGDMPSGEGYDLCKSICHQTGHAEENAIKEAGKKSKGSVLYLIGHTRICDNCQKLIDQAGISKTIIINNIIGEDDAGINNCNT